MSRIHINITKKFTDKVIIGVWCIYGLDITMSNLVNKFLLGLMCFNVFMIFKIREQRRALEYKYKKK